MKPAADTKPSCFAHYHMTIDEYGLWTHARELSNESGIFYFDGRKIAERFTNTGKDRPYRIGRRLRDKGWFVCIREPKRLKNGMFSCGQYRILSHAEWVSHHGPDTCACVITSPQTATGAEVTSPQIANDLSSNCERPVAKQGHNLKGFTRKENKLEKRASSSSTENHGQGKTLLATLAVLSDDPLSTFDHGQAKGVIALMQDYSSDEIKAAFRELWGAVSNDDFGRKHFARTFAAKAPQIIAVQRRRLEKERETAEMLRTSTAHEQAKAAEELAARMAQEQAEMALVEDTI